VRHPRVDRPVRRTVVLLAAVCAWLLSLTGPTPARLAGVERTAREGCLDAPPFDGAATMNNVLDELGVSRIPTSYVFVIDVSQSMQRSGLYPQALTALGRFLRAIDPKDQIGVVIFAKRGETALPLAPLTSVSDVISALPERAEGTATDIGAGLSQALGELQDAPPGQPATVVLLTDGIHAPADDSRFPTTTGAEWDKLATRAAELQKSRQISAFAIPLSGASGVDVLCSVFPGTRKLQVGSSPASLTNYLQRTQALTRLETAARLLQDDRDKGVQVEWPPTLAEVDVPSGTTTAQVRLRNAAPHLPAVVDGLRLVANGDLPVVASELPSHIDLAPGQTVEYAVRLDWPAPHDSGWRAGNGRYDTELSLDAHVSSPLADRLRSLPLPRGAPEFSAGILGGPGLLSGLAPLSWNPWPLLVLLVLTVAGVLVALRRWPSMTGQLQLYRMEERDGHDEDIPVATIPLHGRLRRTTIDAVDPRSSDTAAKIVVRAHRHLLTGVVQLRVSIRFTALRRGARRDMDEGGQLLIMGLDVRHVPTQQQLPSATAVLTRPISHES
jgi:VWA domain-containing protein